MASRDHADNPVEALLCGKEEDRFTDFLARLLREKDLASRFLREVCHYEPKRGRPEVHTQVVVPDGRPDLVISGPDYLLVVEAKLASWLHERQLEPYDAFLKSRKAESKGLETMLMLLGPEGSRAAMEAEGKKQAASSYSGVLSWEAVAQFCRTEASVHAGTRACFYLEDFADLIEYRLGDLPRPFTSDEADLLSDPLAARAFNAARIAVADLVEALSKIPSVEIGRTNAGGGYEGYSLRSKGRQWWFGFWPGAWPSVGKSPLMLQLLGLGGDSVPPLLEGVEPAVRSLAEGRRGWVVPLSITPDIDPSQLAAAHARTIFAWVTQAPKSGEIYGFNA
jgi:hypothetical protein